MCRVQFPNLKNEILPDILIEAYFTLTPISECNVDVFQKLDVGQVYCNK